ncbi:hypothetical protein N431DRAFT_475544 [Stipitochalara longipes BDJ]|nr:hypothetical protein N431DRAFT_475544 [Stipitochalara longipes BDJ]
MDPLTITTSIFGLLKATAQVAQYLAPYVSAAKDMPKIVSQVHSEVLQSRSILQGLEQFTNNLSSIPTRRAVLISIDQLQAVFTDGVILFSELESALPSLPSSKTSNARLPIRVRLEWTKKESTFTALLLRLQGFKISISAMLTILRRQSDLHAAEGREKLTKNIAALLESNKELSRRLMGLESEVQNSLSQQRHRVLSTINNLDDRAEETQQPIESTEEETIENGSNSLHALPAPEDIAVSSFDFEDDLETSRVYRRAVRDTMDFSFRSSNIHTNTWSIFSGLSLSDISVLSVIALPLYPEDIDNAQHYGFGVSQATSTTVIFNPPRDSLFEGFLIDERNYVADLEKLIEFKTTIELDHNIHNASLDAILGSLKWILDSQKKLLLDVEMTGRKPFEEQMWAVPFGVWSSMSSMYANLIIDEKGATEYVRSTLAERDRVKDERTRSALEGFIRLLCTPSQRLPRYSGFLQVRLLYYLAAAVLICMFPDYFSCPITFAKSNQEIVRQGNLSDIQLKDVSAGIQALRTALQDVNKAIKDQELMYARLDLVSRVQDWKGFNINHLGVGELLLHDTVSIGQGEPVKFRQYRVYLFRGVLVCCKESPLRPKAERKPVRDLLFRQSKSIEEDSGTILKPKGRIFVTSFKDIIPSSEQRFYDCKILWKSAPSIEEFTMRFSTEKKMKTWYEELEGLRKAIAPAPERSKSPKKTGAQTKESTSGLDGGSSRDEDVDDKNLCNPPLSASTPTPDFAWLKLDQTKQHIANPYANEAQDDAIDDDDLHRAPSLPVRTRPSTSPIQSAAISDHSRDENWTPFKSLPALFIELSRRIIFALLENRKVRLYHCTALDEIFLGLGSFILLVAGNFMRLAQGPTHRTKTIAMALASNEKRGKGVAKKFAKKEKKEMRAKKKAEGKKRKNHPPKPLRRLRQLRAACGDLYLAVGKEREEREEIQGASAAEEKDEDMDEYEEDEDEKER